ncbi:sensor protein CutS [Nocardioides baekrokdamisoli]|uniref:histidine kinase n=1 Tax=Nocardioides baekrokdamisoli TaxID=1804624 RepID=A0A3G9J1Q9_9ACTN|nr:ATP-binding protein [Nocardioides baekrokdamisoli]BBH16919.1 sensor protein CutS [Nocardioides baekrokdamisoli]
MRGVRLTARLRLTLIYSTLFVAFGTALLAVNYRLLTQGLPTGGQFTSTTVLGTGAKSTSLPTLPPGSLRPLHPLHSLQPLPIEGSGTGGKSGTLAVATAISQYRGDTLHQLLRNSVIVLLIGVIVVAAVVWLIARWVLAPLRRITDAARRVSGQDLSGRVALSGPRDELFDLARTLNGTFDRLEAAFDHERRLIANTSHELRTPVANQRTLLEVVLDNPGATADELREACVISLAQTRRTEALIDGMLALAGAEHAELDLQPLRLDELVQHVVAEVDTTAVTVEIDVPPVTVVGDELYCRILIGNLINNAVGHNVGAGWVTISTTSGTDGTNLVVSNSSRPLSEDQIAELREPFRRGGAARTGSTRGTGLGLAIVDTIADVHGWTTSFSVPTAGTFQAVVGMATDRGTSAN